jgi:hypothetical protein
VVSSSSLLGRSARRAGWDCDLCLRFPVFRGARLLYDDERAHMGQADFHRIHGEDLDRALVVAPVVGI